MDLNSLRNYLLGAIGIEIQTDEQSVSFTMSNENANVEMKR